MKSIIRGAEVFNTYTKTFERKEIIFDERMILEVKDTLSEDDLFEAKIIEAKGQWVIPGLIDIHMHIESSMTTPKEFSKRVIPHGVTTVVADPHEIANVFGIKGIKSFMDHKTGLDIFYGIPSSVPSTSSEYETTGGIIGLEEVELLLKEEKVICLGEVMNFKDLVAKEDTLIKKIIALCKEKRPLLLLEGHCPKISGSDLSMYLQSGVNGDHTMQTPQSIVEKIKNGMFLEIQGKCITAENIKTLVDNHFYEYFALVTDDTMPNDLLKGQLDKIVLKAHSYGLGLNEAIYTATYTPARRMRLDDRGVIAPGKIADLVILDSLEELKTSKVFKNGELYYDKEKGYQKKEAEYEFPSEFYHSLKLAEVNEDTFKVKTDPEYQKVKVNVIKIAMDSTFTKLDEALLDVVDGEIKWEESGLSLLCCLERYGKNHNIAFAFTKGAIKEKGAIASSWAHDHHNLMVMGTSVKDMVKIANTVIIEQGGYGVSTNEEVKAFAKLNVGGIVYDGPLEILAENIDKVKEVMINDLGYDHYNPIMSFATLSLPVSPSVKLVDKGIMIGKELKIIPLVKEGFKC